MKIGQKLYVSDWGKRYSTVFTWKDGIKKTIFPWKTQIPDYSDAEFFWKIETRPMLTQKGVPFKNGATEVVSRTPIYEDFEYQVEEMYEKEDTTVCLLSSEPGCWVQVSIAGLSLLTPEDQAKVKHLEQKERFQALAVANLGKWDIDLNVKDFPKQLVKYLYDRNQSVLFGSSMSKGIVKYPYIPKEYTKNGNPILIGSEVLYNGEGCDLSDKETVTWNELPALFPENKFR